MGGLLVNQEDGVTVYASELVTAEDLRPLHSSNSTVLKPRGVKNSGVRPVSVLGILYGTCCG